MHQQLTEGILTHSEQGKVGQPFKILPQTGSVKGTLVGRTPHPDLDRYAWGRLEGQLSAIWVFNGLL
jgi:hypothetical protein